MALANSADAVIQPINLSGSTLTLSGANESDSFTMDLDGDTVSDFNLFGSRFGFTSYITTTSYPVPSGFTTTYDVRGSLQGSASTFNTINRFATTGFSIIRRLNPGSGVSAAISAGAGQNAYFLYTYYSAASTNVLNVGNTDQRSGYVGVSFDISGNTHYGWLEILIARDGGRPSELSVLSGAYEDVAGVDIAAGAIPEPASVGMGLGLLALGAAGVRRMRQRSE